MRIKDTPESYRAYMREWHRKHPINRKSKDLKKKYGITFANYQEMFNKQNGVCKVCLCPETQIHPITKVVQMLSVDHCHKTGKVRSLLCSKCNRTLGMVQDDVDLLRALATYVEESSV